MRIFGIRFTNTSSVIELIDIETGSILLEGPWSIGRWLEAYKGEYTLVLVD